MTIPDLIEFATGTFLAEGTAENNFYVNHYFRDADRDTRRETMFDGLTRKEANDIVRKLTEAQRAVTSVLDKYQDRIYR